MALLAALSACGYSFAASGRLAGGVERAAVLPFENRSTEPEVGAVLAGALRDELAARGALARGSSAATIVGELRVAAPAPAAAGGTSWRVALDVRARLLDGDRVVTERALRREADYSAGVDALETEGRRTQALRRLAAECARELASSLME
jgi:hypothetical protein